MIDIQKYLNKPYKWNCWTGEGYDCLSLVIAVLEDFFKTEIRYIWKYRHSYEDIQKDPYIMRDNIGLYLQEIWTGDHRTFDPDILQVGDVLVFRIYKYPIHAGVFIGETSFISISEGQTVQVHGIDNKQWIRRLVGVYRWQEQQPH